MNKNGYNQKDSKCFVQCFEKQSLEILKSKTNLSRIYLLWEDEAHLKDLDSKNRLLKNKKMWQSALKWAKNERIDGFGVDKNFISSKNAENYVTSLNSYMVEDARENGMLIHVYTFAHDQDEFSWTYGKDPYLEYQSHFNIGIDGYFTDFPGTAKRFLNVKGRCHQSVNSASRKQDNFNFLYVIFFIFIIA